MSRKRIIGIAVVLFVAAACTALLIRMRLEKHARAETAAPPAVAVDAVSPARSTLHRVVEVFGSLAPKSATEVKSELLARVQRVQVKEWDAVKVGDVLLELEPTDLMLTVGREEAGLKMARAQLLQAGVDRNRANREWTRAVRLKEGGLVTGQELDERKSGLESAQARVALAEAQVGQAESQLAEARHNLTKARICAPIEGVVSHRQVDVGDFVDKGTPLFTIVDNRLLDFTANVSALDLVHVVEGQPVVFSVDGLPGREFRGRVQRVTPWSTAATARDAFRPRSKMAKACSRVAFSPGAGWCWKSAGRSWCCRGWRSSDGTSNRGRRASSWWTRAAWCVPEKLARGWRWTTAWR